MKISAMPAGAAGTPGVDLSNVHVGVTASAEKLAAAKAIAAGKEYQRQESDPQLDRALSVRKIKMRTNYSTNRDESPEETAAPATETTDSTTSDQGGQAQAAVESTQPLSPQFAALAKERRQLQVMKQELAKEREAIEQSKSGKSDDVISKAELLANPLKIFEAGLTYDQLTEAILAQQGGITPELKALKEELQALKGDVDKRFVSQVEAQEEAALNTIADEIESLSKEGDTYELIRSKSATETVLNKIYAHYKKTGQVLDTQEVMNQVEQQLLDEAMKYTSIGKVKSKLAPEPAVQNQPESQGKQMKTLTNRDGAAVPMSRRARAIAAMNGTLRK